MRSGLLCARAQALTRRYGADEFRAKDGAAPMTRFFLLGLLAEGAGPDFVVVDGSEGGTPAAHTVIRSYAELLRVAGAGGIAAPSPGGPANGLGRRRPGLLRAGAGVTGQKSRAGIRA
ncbi:hypothetical protein [Nocardia nova]|uniref:hypothetical protein n=1 Tax=Nocardia nova TaxID=37330 RepID=UPI00046D93B8|nr:hypothetical protein [Nocardia nova]